MALRRLAMGAGGLLVGAGLLAGCGPPAGSAARGTAAVRSACQEVAAVLSDGPDPAADPVGYAEAQILPLRQIRSTDGALRRAIDDLSTAYQRFYRAGGVGSAARAAVASSRRRVDAICPGAAS